VLAAADATVPTLVVTSDIRTGLAGGADERDGGDAAAALVFGEESPGYPVIATVLGTASTTDEFLERWRTPGDPASRGWEERFGEHLSVPLAEESFTAALKNAGLAPGDVDHLVVCGLATRAARQFAKTAGTRPETLADDLASTVGNPGAAQPALLLASVLEKAAPGETVALVQLADGATTLLLRTTEAVAARRPVRTVAQQIASPGRSVRYLEFLAWRGLVDREPPRRPEPEAPAAPPTHRSGGFKYGFHASRCGHCSTINLPPNRVCFSCGTIDEMSPVSMSQTQGTVATFTVDRLAFTPSPPMIAVVVDFDGGGRFRCELADGTPDDIAIGSRVELTFRRLLTAGGVHNYFWKARIVRPDAEESS